MASEAELMIEMADAIRSVVDGNDWEVQVEPLPVLNPTPPTVDIWPADPSNDGQTAGFAEAVELGAKLFTIRARCNTPDVDAGWDVILELRNLESDNSVAQAVTDDQTLGGKASQVVIRDQSGIRPYQELGGSLTLGCEWTVLVVD